MERKGLADSPYPSLYTGGEGNTALWYSFNWIFLQCVFHSIILVGGEEIISLMLSPALITAHLFLQRPKTKELEIKLAALAPSGFKEQIPWGSPCSIESLSKYSAAENEKAEKVPKCHKVGISKGVWPVQALCSRTVVYAQHEDWMERPYVPSDIISQTANFWIPNILK